jgi:hypothetical protein
VVTLCDIRQSNRTNHMASRTIGRSLPSGGGNLGLGGCQFRPEVAVSPVLRLHWVASSVCLPCQPLSRLKSPRFLFQYINNPGHLTERCMFNDQPQCTHIAKRDWEYSRSMGPISMRPERGCMEVANLMLPGVLRCKLEPY